MKRDFLTIPDLKVEELRKLLQRAAALKAGRASTPQILQGKTVALVFQKPSMRTRVAFEVAVLELGGAVIYLGQEDIQLGRREAVKDVARVLSRYVHGIVLRTFGHANAEEFAKHATVPVINGLSDLVHPCQALADVMTMQEAFGRLQGLKAAYIGDGNNVLHSLIEACARLGVSVAVAAPKGYAPNAAIWKAAKWEASRHGASLELAADPKQVVRGADVIYTDVWVSMGQEPERAKRLRAFKGYQLNAALLKLAKPGCKVLHCLPAHRGEEITDDVMEGPPSLVVDQAENRLHAHKALLEFLIGSSQQSAHSSQQKHT
ncbi:MAG: ornithine carbamoyltransferase [Candidatus Omnitrophica bacterium]|nr:ornithine carbamoyltransferase [Candidatus Omnitrophota bacterium]